MSSTESELAEVVAALATNAEMVKRRDLLILQMRAEGHSFNAIAKVAGMSAQSVSYIVKRHEPATNGTEP